MEIKVLMIIGLYYPVIGGAEKECQKLAEALSRKGVKVMVLTQYFDDLPEFEVINGVEIYRKIKASRPWAPTYLLSVIKFLIDRKDKYDIIQCFGIYFYTTASIIVKFLFKKRVINRIENAGIKETGEYGDLNRIKRIKFGFLIDGLWRKVDRLIAISRGIYKELRNRGVKDKSIVYIPNSVDTERFVPATNKKSWDSKIDLIFVGRLAKPKGVDILLKAIRILIDQNFDISLSIVGDGPLKEELQHLTYKLGISSFVSFKGNQKDVLPFYHNSHILVMPSNWEGLPLVLLEGMACGLPIVATDIEGIHEGIEDGANGLLFSPGNSIQLSEKIKFLIEHPDKAIEMGKIGREKALKNFSLISIVDKYIELYRSLLND